MSDYEINEAEKEVKKNTQKLETAIEHLEETVEDASKKVTETIETVQKKIEHTNQKVKNIIKTFREIVDKPKQVVRQAMEKVQRMKSRPKLFWSIIAAVGASAVVGYYLSRRKVHVLEGRNEEKNDKGRDDEGLLKVKEKVKRGLS